MTSTSIPRLTKLSDCSSGLVFRWASLQERGLGGGACLAQIVRSWRWCWVCVWEPERRACCVRCYFASCSAKIGPIYLMTLRGAPRHLLLSLSLSLSLSVEASFRGSAGPSSTPTACISLGTGSACLDSMYENNPILSDLEDSYNATKIDPYYLI